MDTRPTIKAIAEVLSVFLLILTIFKVMQAPPFSERVSMFQKGYLEYLVMIAVALAPSQPGKTSARVVSLSRT